LIVAASSGDGVQICGGTLRQPYFQKIKRREPCGIAANVAGLLNVTAAHRRRAGSQRSEDIAADGSGVLLQNIEAK
jgi:hypothetical protein